MKLLPLFLFFSLNLFAQQKPAAPKMPDIEAMKRLTPAQLEVYKQQMLKQASVQAKAVSNQYNLKVNEMALPDFKLQPPPKDYSKLNLLPQKPPTLIQIADGLRQSKKQLESVTPKTVLDEVKKIETLQTPAEQQSSSLAAFYADRPAHGLLVSMNAALQNINEATGLNNLAAMFNMVKLEQKAVPILMNLLAADPTNSTVLNNMSQAYLGMGDLFNAEAFLKRCLAEDELHPEGQPQHGTA